jgi:hypothetical protein
MATMSEPVQEGSRQRGITKDLDPVGKHQIGFSNPVLALSAQIDWLAKKQLPAAIDALKDNE